MKKFTYSQPVAISFIGCLLVFVTAGLAAAQASLDATTPDDEDLAGRQTADEVTVDDNWIDIITPSGLVGVQGIGKGLSHCGDVKLSDDAGGLIASAGTGVVAAISKRGDSRAANLISNKSFEDCEVRLEFLIGEGSNSGVKLQQRYEVQLYDSHGRDKPTARDCGGIYPHWIFRTDGKGLKYIDQGTPPITNAARAAGEWQTLCIVFRAPRFDEDGKKIRNARFESVVLNGQVVQRNAELDSPTGNASTPLAETPRAKLLLQMDHGPVAFRNVRVRPL